MNELNSTSESRKKCFQAEQESISNVQTEAQPDLEEEQVFDGGPFFKRGRSNNKKSSNSHCFQFSKAFKKSTPNRRREFLDESGDQREFEQSKPSPPSNKRDRTVKEHTDCQGPGRKKQLLSPPTEPSHRRKQSFKGNVSRSEELGRRSPKIMDTIVYKQPALPSPAPSRETVSPASDAVAMTARLDCTDQDTVSIQRAAGSGLPHMPPILAPGSAVARFNSAIVQNIVACVLEPPQVLRPFYLCGMLENGLNANTEVPDSNTIDCDNIDLSILRTCKAFHKVGANYFYSENEFAFSDPCACR